MKAHAPGQPVQHRAWALVPRRPGSRLHFVYCIVAEQFPEMEAAYVYELKAGTGHFVPFARLASSLPRAREVARQVLTAEKSAPNNKAGAASVPAAA